VIVDVVEKLEKVRKRRKKGKEEQTGKGEIIEILTVQ
jgi:hypothetical protein